MIWYSRSYGSAYVIPQTSHLKSSWFEIWDVEKFLCVAPEAGGAGEGRGEVVSGKILLVTLDVFTLSLFAFSCWVTMV